MNFELVSNDGEKTIAIIDDDMNIHPPIHESNPNFKQIVSYALRSEELTEEEYDHLLELLDLSVTVSKKFERLSDRVTVANGLIYFDGDPVHSALGKQIMRFLEDQVADWRPLVRFFEKVQSNPNEHSREQLYDWLMSHNFTLTDNGDIVGYKGVKKEGGKLLSVYAGHAIVNGEDCNGHISNEIGNVVEMPRSEVAHDPSTACSTGLHVGTYKYALHYAQGAMLKVEVNPRDVVSVPTDAAGEKVRVCRYQVVDVIDAPIQEAVVSSYRYDEDYWGDGEDLVDEDFWGCDDADCPDCNCEESYDYDDDGSDFLTFMFKY